MAERHLRPLLHVTPWWPPTAPLQPPSFPQIPCSAVCEALGMPTSHHLSLAHPLLRLSSHLCHSGDCRGLLTHGRPASLSFVSGRGGWALPHMLTLGWLLDGASCYSAAAGLSPALHGCGVKPCGPSPPRPIASCHCLYSITINLPVLWRKKWVKGFSMH